MKVILTITDDDTKEMLLGVGAEELKSFHFPKLMGIECDKVLISTLDELDVEGVLNGVASNKYNENTST